MTALRMMIVAIAAVGLLAGNTVLAGYKEGRAALRAKDYETAAKEFRKDAERGGANSQFRLGLLYERGNGVGQSDEEARKWYRLAAEQDHRRGQYRLGRLLRKGLGGPQDLVEAWVMYTLSLQKKHSEDKDAWRRWIEERMTYDQLAEAKKRAAEWRPKK